MLSLQWLGKPCYNKMLLGKNSFPVVSSCQCSPGLMDPAELGICFYSLMLSSLGKGLGEIIRL